MTLTREQAQFLTRTIHLLRPAWNEEGIYAALGRVRDRNPIDVALAALRAAGDTKAKTPGVIPTDGPHWHEAPAVTATPKPMRLSRDEQRARTCATCGVLDCGGPDHPFVSLERASQHRTEPLADVARAELAQAHATHCSHGVKAAACTAHRAERAEPTTEETHA